MRKLLVRPAITAALVKTAYQVKDIAGGKSPFNTGDECVLVINPNNTITVATFTVSTTNSQSAGAEVEEVLYTGAIVAGNAPIFLNCKLGDEIYITATTVGGAGPSLEVFLLGDS